MTTKWQGNAAGLARFVGRCTLLLAASAALSASPAGAAEADVCRGHWVRNLAGTHAVTRQTMPDVASLRQRLPELEASIRTVIAKDPTLSPAVADALITAIRDGSRVGERLMARDEAVLWMAYQPEPGRIDAISPACLRLERNHEAFELTVEVPEPAAAARTANCAIAATRNCAGDDRLFTVDLRGSSPGARATMTTGGRPAVAIGGTGETWTVADPGPYDLDATFTVRVDGGTAAARTARVYRFLMPKACGNLAYLGEAPTRTIAAAGAPISCEKSVVVGRCAPVAAAVATPAPAYAESAMAADRCEEGWIFRPFFFGYFPTGDDQERDIFLPWIGPARERFELTKGYGVGASLERRMGPVFGLEGALMIGRGTSKYTLDHGVTNGDADHSVTFQASRSGRTSISSAAAAPISTSGRSSATAASRIPTTGSASTASWRTSIVASSGALSSGSTCRSVPTVRGASTPACATSTSPRTPMRARSRSIRCCSSWDSPTGSEPVAPPARAGTAALSRRSRSVSGSARRELDRRARDGFHSPGGGAP